MAKRFGVGLGHAQDVRRGRSWRHVPGPIPSPNVWRGAAHPQAKLSEEDVLSIRAAAEGGSVTYSEIGRVYQITKAHVSLIVKRKRWGHV